MNGPTEYPIGDVPGLDTADVIAIAQAGFRTAADLHRAAFDRVKANRMVDSRKSWESLVAILIGVFAGDGSRASRCARCVRAETHRRLAAFNAGSA